MNVVQFYEAAGIVLTKSGNRWISSCPFPGHKDTAPSFVVYQDGSYHCFGCGAHGNTKTLQKAFGVNYRPFPDFDSLEDKHYDLVLYLREKLEPKIKLEAISLSQKKRFLLYDKIDQLFLIAKSRSKRVGVTRLDLLTFVNSNASKLLEKIKNFS